MKAPLDMRNELLTALVGTFDTLSSITSFTSEIGIVQKFLLLYSIKFIVMKNGSLLRESSSAELVARSVWHQNILVFEKWNGNGFIECDLASVRPLWNDAEANRLDGEGVTGHLVDCVTEYNETCLQYNTIRVMISKTEQRDSMCTTLLSSMEKLFDILASLLEFQPREALLSGMRKKEDFLVSTIPAIEGELHSSIPLVQLAKHLESCMVKQYALVYSNLMLEYVDLCIHGLGIMLRSAFPIVSPVPDSSSCFLADSILNMDMDTIRIALNSADRYYTVIVTLAGSWCGSLYKDSLSELSGYIHRLLLLECLHSCVERGSYGLHIDGAEVVAEAVTGVAYQNLSSFLDSICFNPVNEDKNTESHAQISVLHLLRVWYSSDDGCLDYEAFNGMGAVVFSNAYRLLMYKICEIKCKFVSESHFEELVFNCKDVMLNSSVSLYYLGQRTKSLEGRNSKDASAVFIPYLMQLLQRDILFTSTVDGKNIITSGVAVSGEKSEKISDVVVLSLPRTSLLDENLNSMLNDVAYTWVYNYICSYRYDYLYSVDTILNSQSTIDSADRTITKELRDLNVKMQSVLEMLKVAFWSSKQLCGSEVVPKPDQFAELKPLHEIAFYYQKIREVETTPALKLQNLLATAKSIQQSIKVDYMKLDLLEYDSYQSCGDYLDAITVVKNAHLESFMKVLKNAMVCFCENVTNPWLQFPFTRLYVECMVMCRQMCVAQVRQEEHMRALQIQELIKSSTEALYSSFEYVPHSMASQKLHQSQCEQLLEDHYEKLKQLLKRVYKIIGHQYHGGMHLSPVHQRILSQSPQIRVINNIMNMLMLALQRSTMSSLVKSQHMHHHYNTYGGLVTDEGSVDLSVLGQDMVVDDDDDDDIVVDLLHDASGRAVDEGNDTFYISVKQLIIECNTILRTSFPSEDNDNVDGGINTSDQFTGGIWRGVISATISYLDYCVCEQRILLELDHLLNGYYTFYLHQEDSASKGSILVSSKYQLLTEISDGFVSIYTICMDYQHYMDDYRLNAEEYGKGKTTESAHASHTPMFILLYYCHWLQSMLKTMMHSDCASDDGDAPDATSALFIDCFHKCKRDIEKFVNTMNSLSVNCDSPADGLSYTSYNNSQLKNLQLPPWCIQKGMYICDYFGQIDRHNVLLGGLEQILLVAPNQPNVKQRKKQSTETVNVAAVAQDTSSRMDMIMEEDEEESDSEDEEAVCDVSDSDEEEVVYAEDDEDLPFFHHIPSFDHLVSILDQISEAYWGCRN